MQEQIELIIDTYYDYSRPKIGDLQVLSESPEFGLMTLRWREQDKTVTVKAHIGDSISIIELT